MRVFAQGKVVKGKIVTDLFTSEGVQRHEIALPVRTAPTPEPELHPEDTDIMLFVNLINKNKGAN